VHLTFYTRVNKRPPFMEYVRIRHRWHRHIMVQHNGLPVAQKRSLIDASLCRVAQVLVLPHENGQTKTHVLYNIVSCINLYNLYCITVVCKKIQMIYWEDQNCSIWYCEMGFSPPTSCGAYLFWLTKHIHRSFLPMTIPSKVAPMATTILLRATYLL